MTVSNTNPLPDEAWECLFLYTPAAGQQVAWMSGQEKGNYSFCTCCYNLLLQVFFLPYLKATKKHQGGHMGQIFQNPNDSRIQSVIPTEACQRV